MPENRVCGIVDRVNSHDICTVGKNTWEFIFCFEIMCLKINKSGKPL